MKRIFYLTVLLLSVLSEIQAQVVPVQGQYLINPYIYNPARLAEDGYTQFTVGFRKQWLGVDGSPTVASVSFEHPFNEQIAIGGQLTNYSEGPFNQTQLHFTGSYRLAVDSYEEHFVTFGMSLGARNSNFNTSKLDDPDDPALAQVASNNTSIDGAFGLAYEYDKLQIGISMPHLTRPQFISNDSFGPVEIEPWQQMIFTAGYNFFVDYYQDWKIQPQLLYHYDADFDNQIEGFVTAKYQDTYWGGVGYRQDYGISIMAGANINEMFSLNYSYGLSSPSADIPNDTHEITLRIRLGEKKRKKESIEDENEDNEKIEDEKTEEDNNEVVKPTPVTPEVPKEEEKGIFRVDKSISLDNYHPEIIEIRLPFDSKKIFGRKPNRELFDLSPNNYIMTGEYKYMSGGEDDIKRLKEKGLDPKFVYDSKEKKYYMYLITKDSLEDARRIVLSLRKLKGFENTKLLILE